MNVAIVVDPTKLDAFVTAARKAASYGLMRCSSGNMSCRLDERHMLVKSSRSWMAELTAADVSVCRIDDGSLVQGRRPSVEMGFHSGVLRCRPEVQVVLHFQTPYATSFACRQPPIDNYSIVPEVPYYIGPIAHVPYIRPGSPELAQAVIAALAHHDLAQLSNHGQVVVGNSFDDAIQKAVFFELACELLHHSGSNAKLLTPEAIKGLTSTDAKV